MACKICTKCKIEKDISDFGIKKECKDGLNWECKKCTNDRAIKSRKNKTQETKDRDRKNKSEWYIKNKERHNEMSRKYREENKGSIRIKINEWEENNKERLEQTRKEWFEKNRLILNKKSSERNKIRSKNDKVFVIKRLVRGRIWHLLKSKGLVKNKKTEEMLGCSFDELKTHLENKFQDGMNWDNQGKWHIDHIIPLASANSIEEIVELCNYKNLQPLWAIDNIKKGAKIL